MKVTTRATISKTAGREMYVHSISDIQSEMRRHGAHYWGPEEKRYFGSRTHGGVFPNKRGTRFYFVESSKPPHGPRFYRVLMWKPSAPRDIERVEHRARVEGEADFMANEKFGTAKRAMLFAEKCARLGHGCWRTT